MQLSAQNLYHYLHQKGLLDTESVVNGHYTVQEFNTRTQIKKVLMKAGPSLFIKQAQSNELSAGMLKREYDAYNLMNRSGLFPDLSAALPQLLHYDSAYNVLITELIPESINLQEYYMNSRQFPDDIARQQAALLTTFNRAVTAETDTATLPKILPWVLQLQLHEATAFFPQSPESAKLIAIIKENKFLIEQITAVAAQWKYTHFIHGDVKWVNFLVEKHNDQIRLKLIDWELADIGDPLWDAAGLLQSYISIWIFGFDNNNPQTPHFPENFMSFHISAMQQSARTYLYTYLELTGIAVAEQPAVLEKIMRYTALRIIQTSIEGVEFDPTLRANNMRCIQLAFNILNDPTHAIWELLQIKIDKP